MLVRWVLILFLASVFQLPLLAQKQANIWYFGEGAGLDFNHNPPKVLTDGQIDMYLQNNDYFNEGSATISDSEGQLLFYTNGEMVWNRNHEVMQNGEGLLGYHSSSQSALIVPAPGNASLYYVFTTDGFQNDLKNGLRYSVVDICGDSGLGEVVPSMKNILLLELAGEKLTMAEHANGMDYWVIAHKHHSNAFYTYHISENGISDTIISEIGSYHGLNAYSFDALGQMKVSPDARKLALVSGNRSPNPELLELFDFDNATGKISNFIDLYEESGIHSTPFGVAFSTDNSKLYINHSHATYQYSLDAGDGSTDAIKKSMYAVWNTFSAFGLQLGPDGKIYGSSRYYLHVIDKPNLAGAACNFLDSAIYLGGKQVEYFSPSFLDSFNYPDKDIQALRSPFIERDTLFCQKDTLMLLADVGDPDATYAWLDGSKGPSYSATSSGTYWAEAFNEFCTVQDSITIDYYSIDLGPDTAACQGEAIVLDALVPWGEHYTWQDGVESGVYTVKTTGLYVVDVAVEACSVVDSVFVSFKPLPTFSLGNDTTLCMGETHELYIEAQADRYVWQDSSDNNTYQVTEAGIYSATAVLDGCYHLDDMQVTYTPRPNLDLGTDTLLCIGDVLTLHAHIENATYLWSNGSEDSITYVAEPDQYWVQASVEGCTDSDTIQVDYTDCILNYPNFFSPNADTFNDLFIPKEVSGVSWAELRIYNRWGEEIFKTNDILNGWDGNIGGNDAESGVYFWLIDFIDVAGRKKDLKGWVTLAK